MEANRSVALSAKAKHAVGHAFKSAQKTFQKCQTMNELTQTGGWSYADQDYTTVNRHGVGGAAHTFKYASGLHTNDRVLYKDTTFNNTQRYKKGQDRPEDESQFYFYKGADNKLQKLNLMN